MTIESIDIRYSDYYLQWFILEHTVDVRGITYNIRLHNKAILFVISYSKYFSQFSEFQYE